MNASSIPPTDVAPDFRWKRVYDAPSPGDGTRILIDRLWPRGVVKAELDYDEWFKDIAPSPALRTWFGHLPERWEEFRRRYTGELSQMDPAVFQDLADKARLKPVTFLIAAHDRDHNHAIVLTDFLRKKFSAKMSAKTKTVPPPAAGKHMPAEAPRTPVRHSSKNA